MAELILDILVAFVVKPSSVGCSSHSHPLFSFVRYTVRENVLQHLHTCSVASAFPLLSRSLCHAEKKMFSDNTWGGDKRQECAVYAMQKRSTATTRGVEMSNKESI